MSKDVTDLDQRLIYTDIALPTLSAEEIHKLAARLTAYFRAKVEGTENQRLKRQRLAAGLLFIYTFRQMGYEAEKITIAEGEYGKPLLKEPAGLYFSLSHSEDLILLAVSDAEIGCDIQKIRSGGDIPSRFFTEREREILDESDEAGRAELFTRIWARKESYIKATGEGMKRDLGSFCVLDEMTSDGYLFSDYMLNGYAAAVCVKAEGEAPKPREGTGDICFLPFQNLVNVIL